MDDPVTVRRKMSTELLKMHMKKVMLKANPPKVRTGKKVAVIGSGPSGLAAADQLNKQRSSGNRI